MADDPLNLRRLNYIQSQGNKSTTSGCHVPERSGKGMRRTTQLLLEEQDGYRLIEGLQEPGVSLPFISPCFSDCVKYSRAKMTEVFVDSTFGTNKHGYELYCVLTENDLVSLPLSYLLLDTRGVHEEGKRGARLTREVFARCRIMSECCSHRQRLCRSDSREHCF
ncbi:uncharacterized protein V1513DRAFT_163138 [Lipomyces chichibuensis]|uniref:uncharacterized protein n=1 Tax=Lipomyces chichibuensis TaxID=1546026 RepID=UPI003343C621